MSELGAFLTGVANAIREKKETTAPIPAQSFASEIRSIEGGSKVTDIPLTLTENNTEIIGPEGIRYTPITVSIPEIYQEKRIVPTKEEQVVVADEGYNALSQVIVEPIPDDYVNKNEVPKPTLNAPKISVGALYGKVVVDKTINGQFAKEYLLYINGELKAVYTEDVIPVGDYIPSGNNQIQVKCRNDEYFIESDFSNTIVWDVAVSGTIGLTYSGSACTGIGKATGTEIYVASFVNDVLIDAVAERAFQNIENKIFYLDTIKMVSGYAFTGTKNVKIVFGEGIYTFYTSFEGSVGLILDFRKAKKVPYLIRPLPAGTITIVPDVLYDDWVIATNWSANANGIIGGSDYEAQQGGTV